MKHKSATCLLFGLLISIPAVWGFSPDAPSVKSEIPPSKMKSCLKDAEGPVVQGEMVVGPFDIHRKYRSMEGPFCNQDVRVGELLDSHRVSIDQSKVFYSEDDGKMPPSMKANAPGMFNSGPSATDKHDDNGISGLVRREGKNRELYWWKGIKLEVIDENNKVMPTAEFICHFNMDINVSARDQRFPDGERTNNERLVSLTQGETEFYFPDGFGVPVASDEIWRFGFQAANRNSNDHRVLRHRCIVYFVKDSDLKKPITALHWYVPYCTVVMDHNSENATQFEHMHSPNCISTQQGVLAPNRGAQLSVWTDTLGRHLTGHWVVPPGQHTYTSPISDDRASGFADKDRRIHAAWTHIHPLCTATSLVQCDGQSRHPLYTANIKTKTEGGLEIKTIEPISSKEGIFLPKGQHYELEGVYDNITGVPQDSMVSAGIFCADSTFKRPVWVTSPVPEESSASVADSITRFDSTNDGPLLAQDKYMEIETTAGKIHLVLEPGLAPQHATYLYNLFMKGAFTGTLIFDYHPFFVMQIANPDFKADGQPQLSDNLKSNIRRLPLEVKKPIPDSAMHKAMALSMARDQEPDSALGSFCIMLGEAPHLDGEYTVFGHVLSDQTTKATLAQIGADWSKKKPWIVSVQEMPNMVNPVVSLPQKRHVD